MHVCVYGVCVWIYILTHMHAFMISTKHPHQFTYKNMVLFIYTHTHTYIHTYIHTCIHTFIHIRGHIELWMHTPRCTILLSLIFCFHSLLTYNSPDVMAEFQWRTAMHCDKLEHTSTCCNTLQHAATRCNHANTPGAEVQQRAATHYNILRHNTTHCNTLQHIATYCNTLQRSATPCNTLQHIATHCNTLQHSATLCNTLQHIETHCNTLQHFATTKAHQMSRPKFSLQGVYLHYICLCDMTPFNMWHQTCVTYHL